MRSGSKCQNKDLVTRLPGSAHRGRHCAAVLVKGFGKIIAETRRVAPFLSFIGSLVKREVENVFFSISRADSSVPRP